MKHAWQNELHVNQYVEPETDNDHVVSPFPFRSRRVIIGNVSKARRTLDHWFLGWFLRFVTFENFHDPHHVDGDSRTCDPVRR